jgi:hypothetical protein
VRSKDSTAPVINEHLTVNSSIYNTTGLLVLEKQVQGNGLSVEIGLETLPQGAYIIKLKSQYNVIVQSFMKE